MHTLFGGLAASGWHTVAITMRLMVEGGLPLAGGIIGSGGEISWPNPTRPGDALSVLSEIVEVTPSRSRADRGTVQGRPETSHQRGGVVQTLLARLVVPRRTALAAPYIELDRYSPTPSGGRGAFGGELAAAGHSREGTDAGVAGRAGSAGAAGGA